MFQEFQQEAGPAHRVHKALPPRRASLSCHRHQAKILPIGTGEFDMSDMALPGSIEPALRRGPDLDKGFHPLTGIIYMGVVAAALLFVAYSSIPISTRPAPG
jgi:hypothetical protein